MDGGRYSVNIEFEFNIPPGKTMGKNITRLEMFLPPNANVSMAREDEPAGVLALEVILPAGTPAMALRDVVHAVEMVTVTPGGRAVEQPLGDLRRATVTRVGDAPEWSFERREPSRD
jgi:hypothetical protein